MRGSCPIGILASMPQRMTTATFFTAGYAEEREGRRGALGYSRDFRGSCG